MSAVEHQSQNTGPLGIPEKWVLPGGVALGLAVSIIIAMQMSEQTKLPAAITEKFLIIDWINVAEQWLKDNYQEATRKFAAVIEGGLEWLDEFLLFKPWVFIVLGFALPSLAFGGLRLALLSIIGVCFWGSMDMWDPAMSTLALMGMSVLLSVIFGVGLGILCSQNDTVEAIVRPVLDTMQTMPSFVYLIPAIFFFGIGGAPAILATMIYAMPPMVRLTNLGIRQVPDNTMEAAKSFGSTRLQTLYKVQIPLALPSIMLGINQTVMMALGLVVLATFIGAGGLGDEVWQALRQLNVGWSLEGGLSIVFMAIIFDRLSYAMSGKVTKPALGPGQLEFRFLPQSWDGKSAAIAVERVINAIWHVVAAGGNAFARFIGTVIYTLTRIFSADFAGRIFAWVTQHAFLVTGLALLYAVLLFDQHVTAIGDYPDALKFTLRGPVDRAVDWLVVDPTFVVITKAIRAFTYLYLLNPLVKFLTLLPWWYTIAAFGIVAWLSVGWRFAIAAMLCLFFVGAGGVWIFAMETLATIVVCVLVCVTVGVPLGVAAAYNKTFDTLLRPLLDAMQTMPAFVYLIPVLMFFGGNIVSAVIATVIYAVPPVVRLTTLGIQQLPQEINEVSTSFGSSTAQDLFKIKLPMALPSIMLGLNQAVMMALAMQVITPLIGGRGLGHQVFDALNTANTGKGLLAGTGIVLLAIILDRLSQAWSATQRKALGLD